MGDVIYSMGMSLDGYIEDPDGSIAFSGPDDEVHRLANEQAREAAAFLFGRRLYEVMEDYWSTVAKQGDVPQIEAEFAQAYVQTPRIVFSNTLDSVAEGCRLVRSSEAVAEVRRLKQETQGHLDLGGATLAASLIDLIEDLGQPGGGRRRQAVLPRWARAAPTAVGGASRIRIRRVVPAVPARGLTPANAGCATTSSVERTWRRANHVTLVVESLDLR